MWHLGGAGLPVQPDRAAGTDSCYQQWQGHQQNTRLEKNQSWRIRRESSCLWPPHVKHLHQSIWNDSQTLGLPNWTDWSLQFNWLGVILWWLSVPFMFLSSEHYLYSNRAPTHLTAAPLADLTVCSWMTETTWRAQGKIPAGRERSRSLRILRWTRRKQTSGLSFCWLLESFMKRVRRWEWFHLRASTSSSTNRER